MKSITYLTSSLALFVCIALMLAASVHDSKSSEAEKKDPTTLQKLKKWEEGYLDIHHINTGSGDACFMILPDGTTLLFDAGALNKQEFEERAAPLKATSPVPNDSLPTAHWIANYIQKTHPNGADANIDYALVSHFHGDHYGSLVALGNAVPIKKVIDRNYPEYDFPVDLRKHHLENKTFQDYLAFLAKDEITAESLKVGQSNQIQLMKNPIAYPNFSITNVKANAAIWTGMGESTQEHFTKEQILNHYNGKYNENPLSLAIKISYGSFDYFTGGDNTGLQGFGLPKWFDVETPIAKAVGKVEALTLNHHGNRDATNLFFVNKLDPKVVIQQLWCSDHPGQEVYQRLIHQNDSMEKREIFSTNMHPETLVTYGPWFAKNYKSTQGHILIRIYPKGKEYEVIIINEETFRVKKVYGPYSSQ
ncbi:MULTISPECIES: ComEC/Rec2 family competence protein [Flavobacteriaceae]|uniref:ComEC/Rec2 family competence protein n=1 Tax=Flavobacteriaceae TaxID=49546 RepID=UPI001492E1B8|nr:MULTISPECIES: MBL fold metallo-hydrolase [Allomuricauda]MDC6367612.1 MBL fold metallo-hydrolase [Muricauda sp. AC10]